MSDTLFRGFSAGDLPAGTSLHAGKARDIIDLGDRLLLTVTDRISAFDRVLTAIRSKGEILSRVSLWWFDRTRDVCPNHIIESLSARTTVVRKVKIIPAEVVVRGYLTGSAWRDYAAGRAVPGASLPAGMKKNQKFEAPVITPSTKEAVGHDEPVSGEELVRRGLVPAKVWLQVCEKALALFRRGAEIAASRGLILVDTKYEFGLAPDGGLVLADELHTPDSSRYWYANSYDEIFRAGGEQRQLDKEFFRSWLIARGFMGEGEAPEIPDSVREAVSQRYIEAFEAITGEKFTEKSLSFEAEREITQLYIVKTVKRGR
ncbi:MAG: phosphoribosylaminoimidazolesuccinocarboxamide synthase [Spirochaetales bacterium]|jgi:phosphoribosylaminoimidazole-succinocarboxamide synthase|nr:phosphoribosylaminoimidazolesuccinocarboxamide synthase [Spirochaetales bacterium]